MNENPRNPLGRREPSTDPAPGRTPLTPEPEPSSGGRKTLPILGGIAALVIAVVLLIVLVGGSDDDSNGGNGNGDAFPPNVVEDADIEAYDEGTPERALLEWWQAFQFADAGSVEDLTSKETLDEIGSDELAELVRVRGKGLQGIEVLGATEDGDTASLRVGLLTFQPEKQGEPPPDEPTSSSPTTLRMANEDGDWLFDEPDYLVPMIENLKAAQKQAKQAQDKPEEQTAE